MAAGYYCADSENGDHVDDPSEDALFMLISDLNAADNTTSTDRGGIARDLPIWMSVRALPGGPSRPADF